MINGIKNTQTHSNQISIQENQDKETMDIILNSNMMICQIIGTIISKIMEYANTLKMIIRTKILTQLWILEGN